MGQHRAKVFLELGQAALLVIQLHRQLATGGDLFGQSWLAPVGSGQDDLPGRQPTEGHGRVSQAHEDVVGAFTEQRPNGLEDRTVRRWIDEGGVRDATQTGVPKFPGSLDVQAELVSHLFVEMPTPDVPGTCRRSSGPREE